MASALDPEPLGHDGAGAPYSARYGDRYASRGGALGQARHVFLGGNHLPERWAGRRQFVILETGFGLGNNFLATWQCWRADPARAAQLHFVSVEKHPLGVQDIADGGNRYAAGDPADDPKLAPLRAALAAQWPLPIAGLHRLEFDGGAVVLTLALGDARDVVPQLVTGVDAFFLDGFAPERNPQMWEPALLKSLARLARPQATLATYSAAGNVREALRAHGFAVQRVPGFGLKRHMLSAQFAPRWKLRRHEPPPAHAGPRKAIVVGAGIAGCCCALALVRRGWHVTLLERSGGPAGGASGLPAGLVYPLLSADDNLASRLSRAAYGYAIKSLAALDAATTDDASDDVAGASGAAIGAMTGVASRFAAGASSGRLWQACGVFQQAADAIEEKNLRERLRTEAWPETFARFEDAATAARHLGLRPQRGGAWFARGAVVDARRWCAALLAHARQLGRHTGGSIELRVGFAVTGLLRAGDAWQLAGASGAANGTLAAAPVAAPGVASVAAPFVAPVVVLANAADLAPLLGLAHLPLQSIRGCLSLIDAPPLQGLRAAVGGEGYVVPPVLGAAAVGATYETDAEGVVGTACPAGAGDATQAANGLPMGPERVSAASAANVSRLANLLRDPPRVTVTGEFRAARCVSQDRMPLAGRVADERPILGQRGHYAGAHLTDLPRQDGLYCLAAMGSRGLTLAPLLGELVAAQITGEPAPLEAALCAAVDPARFLLRHLRAPGTARSLGDAAPKAAANGFVAD
jgi:tRNA 5-methylaminomethyl-2-thiouridine biosynthesis bifunctional protein